VRSTRALATALRDLTAQQLELRAQLAEPPLALLALAPLRKVATQATNLFHDGVVARRASRAVARGDLGVVTRCRWGVAVGWRRLRAATPNLLFEPVDLAAQVQDGLLYLLQRRGFHAAGFTASRVARIAAPGV
jgi:hypothetical protein